MTFRFLQTNADIAIAARACGSFVLLITLLSRRLADITHPTVWCEDGTLVIPGFMLDGWRSLAVPVNGYYLLSSKLLSGISLLFGLDFYPFASSVLALVFSWACLMNVWLAPTLLRHRFLCALCCAFIPTDPECFGTPLYSFWWAGLLLLLLVLWQPDRSHCAYRIALTLFAGLSSPLIIAVTPFLWLRSLIYRKNTRDVVIALTATIVAVVQGFVLFAQARTQAPPLDDITNYAIPRFLGGFVVWPTFGLGLFYTSLQWLASLVIVAAIAHSASRLGAAFACLLCLYAATVCLSIARVSPMHLHPVWAGPRYFFYPFITLYWSLLYILADSPGLRRIPIAIIIILGALNATFSWTRPHVDLQWDAHLSSARFFTSYAMPVTTTGRATDCWWSEQFNGRIIPWGQWSPAGISSQTFPYTRVGGGAAAYGSNQKNRQVARLTRTIPGGGDGQSSQLSDVELNGSFVTSDEDTGVIEIRMKRDEQILFRTGPSDGPLDWGSIRIIGCENLFLDTMPRGMTNWSILEFSHTQLPSEFTVQFIDNGTQAGNWLAVGVASQVAEMATEEQMP